MSVNPNTLLAGGISLTYGSMNDLQIAAARMEIEGLQFYKEMVPLMKELNQAALAASEQKATDQIIQGCVSCASDIAQAVVMISTTAKGSSVAEDELTQARAKIDGAPELKVTAKPDQIEEANVVGANHPGSKSESEAVAEITGQRESAPQKTEQEEKAAMKKAKDDKKALADAEQAAMNIKTQWINYGQISQQIVKGSLDGGVGGLCASWVSKAEAKAQFDSTTIQTVTSNMSAINSFNQSQEGKEQAATQAMLAMIQVSSHV